MRITKVFVLGLGLLLAGATAAEAAGRHDRRQGRQRARIRQGVKSGALAAGEAKRLRQGQDHVRRMEKRFEADGSVTAKEKRRLEKAQDAQSRKIHRLKHNEKERGAEQPPATSPSR